MPPEVRKWLFDVRRACLTIERFIAGRTWDDYRADDYLRSAVERQLSIVGEALIQAFHLLPDLERSISARRDMKAFRNILIHEYRRIEHDRVWNIVVGHLPILLKEVSALLPQGEEPTVDDAND